jgi:translation initiation factor IF-3
VKIRLNHQIRESEVRVVSGPEIGIMSHTQAMLIAGAHGMDLIEISATAKPPACIIEELGKWKYDQSKKAKGQKQPNLETKQIQIRPVTEGHDMETKARQANEFLEAGHKVRIIVKFHGRELAHPLEGEQVLDRLLATLDCKVDSRAPLEGKQIVATVSKK